MIGQMLDIPPILQNPEWAEICSYGVDIPDFSGMLLTLNLANMR